MRSPLRLFYDRLYYGFESYVEYIFQNRNARKAVRGVKFEPEFYENFRNAVKPFWARYGVRAKLHWAKLYYALNHDPDPRYIPDDIHYRYIVPHFDDLVYSRSLEDKNMYALLFPGVKQPETVFRRVDGQYQDGDYSPITAEEAFSRLDRDERFFAKPTRDSGQGTNVQALRGADGPEALREMLALYKDGDYIVQRAIAQHPDLAAFNPTSVNTVRVVTLVLDGTPHVLSAIVRIGHAGSVVDNISKGGYQAVIRLEDGTLAPEAYTHVNGKDDTALCSDTGKSFAGAAVPSWDKIRATALDLAVRLPHLKFIGWDFSVDEAGDVVLVEFNCKFSQNQENCGPTFGDMTDQVLSRIFGKPKEKP